MGWKHVEPQFIMRALAAHDAGDGTFPIQGDGTETRSFCYVDDIVEGILTMYEKGGHREIYHIGSDEEITIRDLAARIGKIVGVDLDIRPGELAQGGTPRRCPDISKMRAGVVTGRRARRGPRAHGGVVPRAPRRRPRQRPDVTVLSANSFHWSATRSGSVNN
jgi:nucleoside-diphosphate-sugar epimerase